LFYGKSIVGWWLIRQTNKASVHHTDKRWPLLQHTKKTGFCPNTLRKWVFAPNTLKFYGNWVLDTITHIITYPNQRGINTFIRDKYTPTLSNEHIR
jgi:hypothetical protein